MNKQAILHLASIICIPVDNVVGSTLLTVRCDLCSSLDQVTYKNFARRIRSRGGWHCRACLMRIMVDEAKNNPLYNDPEYCKKFADLHRDKQYYKKVHSKSSNNKISESLRRTWESVDFLDKEIRKRNDPSKYNERSIRSKELWKDIDYRNNQHKIRRSRSYKRAASIRSKELWKDPLYREKISKSKRKSSMPDDK